LLPGDQRHHGAHATVAPTTFVTFKRWLAGQRDRDAPKRRRDELQADAVQRLVDEYLVVEGR